MVLNFVSFLSRSTTACHFQDRPGWPNEIRFSLTQVQHLLQTHFSKLLLLRNFTRRKVGYGTTFCDLRRGPHRPVLLRFRQSKACSEVKKRLLLHLAANSAALDQANNGSIGFVGGAAGQCLANIHALTLEAWRRLWKSMQRSPTKRGNRRSSGPALICCRNFFSSCNSFSSSNDGSASRVDLRREYRAGPAAAPPNCPSVPQWVRIEH